MNDLQIFEVMRDIVLSVTGVPECIMADQVAPAPAGEYAAINPRNGVQQFGRGIVERNQIPGQLVESKVRTQNIQRCTVNFYRGNALERCEKLENANRLSNISVKLFQAGLSWQKTDPMNNLTALQSGRMEQRAAIDVYLMYETVISDTINNVEHATVEVEDFDLESGE